MTWRLARSLEVYRGEVNAHAPHRSKASDGTIGDAAHASRTSDHNPWVKDSQGQGVVRAMDITHDPHNGLDADALALLIVAAGRGGHPALGAGAYVIRARRIASHSHGWLWRPYTGTNPHDKHVHVSVAEAASGYDSTKSWALWPTNREEDMATTPDDVWNERESFWTPGVTDKADDTMTVRQQLNQARGYAHGAYREVKSLEAKVDDLVKAVQALTKAPTAKASK